MFLDKMLSCWVCSSCCKWLQWLHIQCQTVFFLDWLTMMMKSLQLLESMAVTHKWAGIAQSVWQLATGWMVWGWNPCGGEIFCTCPDQPGAHPASCTMGTGSFPEVKQPGHDTDHTPFYRQGHERVELYLYPPSGPVMGLLYLFTHRTTQSHIQKH
jgi:hypothetical protein